MRVYEGSFRASSSPGSLLLFLLKISDWGKRPLALIVSLRSTAIHTKFPQSLLKLRAVSHVCGFQVCLKKSPSGLLRQGRRLRSLQRTVQVWPRFLSDHQPPWSQDLKNKHKRPRLNLLSGPHSDCIHGARHHTYGPPLWMRAMGPPQAPFHLMLSAINNKGRIEKPQSLMASQEDTLVNICLSCEMDTRRTNSGWVDLTKSQTFLLPKRW